MTSVADGIIEGESEKYNPSGSKFSEELQDNILTVPPHDFWQTLIDYDKWNI